MSIPLRDSMLCVNCECVGENRSRCEVCGSVALMRLIEITGTCQSPRERDLAELERMFQVTDAGMWQ